MTLQGSFLDPPREEEPAQDAPLAARMRPRTLEEFLGQHHLVGEGRALRRAIETDRVGSLILWGPPGSGKTTLARIIAHMAQARFEAMSAVTSGVPELRKIIEASKARRKAGQRTLLFVDEVHRWTKAQQDAVMPHVEEGLFTFIGATTENPSFEVNAALLSRCRVVTLQPLSDEDVRALIERALADEERGLGGRGIEIESEALDALVRLAHGDARTALNALEAAAATAPDGKIDKALVEDVVQRRVLLYDKGGDQHYDVISAFIKSVRGSDPDAAVYWLARMVDAGEDALFIARRLVILASEDVGLANPQALAVAVAAYQAVHFIGMPEGHYPLTEATLYLALSPKSNSALRTYEAAMADVRQHGAAPVPLHLRNAVTGLMRGMGYGKGYQYAHDHESGKAEQQHLPDALAGRRYYVPGKHGAEPRLAAWLERPPE
jgi:putative ATPase